jgi:hypothetical protein
VNELVMVIWRLEPELIRRASHRRFFAKIRSSPWEKH